MTIKPTYQELLEEIEMLKLAIKLEDDTDKRETLENELMYVEEYMEHIMSRGRTK